MDAETVCTQCKISKPTTEFWRISRSDERRSKRCKACATAYYKKYSQERRGQMNEYNRQYRQRWYRRLEQYQKGAVERGYTFTLTADEFLALWSQPCDYCGDALLSGGIDRVDNTRGYEPDNVVPCCSRCNTSKLAMSREQFVGMCKKVAARNA